ncbi:MAG TPA: hypothetical protein VHP38_10575 [Ruminiclostridium sp.]|nr:hypothetical protein [Ruminiclostridium sp.]
MYRINYRLLFGSNLYYRHRISSFRSCAFCRNLYFDRIIKKYICSYREYEACSSLVPCIIPDSYSKSDKTYVEEAEIVPWLFKKPCLNFDVLEPKSYFRNFLSMNLENSIIRLETLEGILTGKCSGEIPCHICAFVNKEVYTGCSYTSRALKNGKCNIIYDNLKEYYSKDNSLMSDVS